MRINEIFYSLQGEGHFTGTPAVFVRLSGCNMKCPFCDTEHEEHTEMSEEEIVREVTRHPATHVVITGGEPTMQLNRRLTDMLHAEGKFIQMETNGTLPVPEGCRIDWITCSPKRTHVSLSHVDELKVVLQHPGQDMECFNKMEATVYSLQPCDLKDEAENARNLKAAIDYCLSNPKWRLSLQTHKMINVR